MRTCATALVLVHCLACTSSSITRQYTGSRTDVAAYGARARVVAVERHVGDDDRVTVDVVFKRGDRVPDAGLVAMRPSIATLVVGSAAIVSGGIIAIAGVCGVQGCQHEHTSYSGGTSSMVNFDQAETELWFVLAGGAIALGGIITTIIGAIPKPTIVKVNDMSLAPVIVKGGGGAALRLAF